MDAKLASFHSPLEWDSNTQPGGDVGHEGSEPDLCSYYFTAEARTVLDEDDEIAALVRGELRDTMLAIRPLFDFGEDDLVNLATCSAVMIVGVLVHTFLPLAKKELPARDCATRQATFRKYSGVGETALCACYYRRALCSEGASDGDGQLRGASPTGMQLEPWLRYHCFDVVGSALGTSQPAPIWTTLNLPQTAAMCAWNNFWTLYLMASLIADDELMSWFDEAIAALGRRVEMVLEQGRTVKS